MSQVPLPERAVLVFDLDDTLYPERDFVRSGFTAVSEYLEQLGCASVFDRLQGLFNQGVRDSFERILAENQCNVEKAALLMVYRDHEPDLSLAPPIKAFLDQWTQDGGPMGILTDGRSLTQRNKIRSLGIDRLTDAVVVSEEIGSEKPAELNYRYFEERFPEYDYVYIGDNLSKDFVTPNRLGWTTVGVRDQGDNIHPQRLEAADIDYLPQFFIERIA